METNSILRANILDIIFDGRNKNYGAYDLRKTYDKRIGSALGITLGAILIFISIASIPGAADSKSKPAPVIDMETEVKKEEKKILPPPPVIPKQIQVKTAIFTPPVIVMDPLVKEPPVENAQLDDIKIGLKNIEGVNETTITAPVEIPGSNAIEVPLNKEVKEQPPFTSVEIEAKFSGNWGSYLKKEIEKNIDELTEAGESGTCMVRFVVSKDGSVSNVEATTMKGTKLAEVAVNAIRKGPKWIPAQQNGMIVNAYRMQPVTFKIQE